MLRALNRKSLVYGVPGLLIQGVGIVIHPAMILLGTVLLIIGLAYYAKAKGHSGLFGLFGLLSWVGILVLIVLKDHYETAEEQAAKGTTKQSDLLLGIVFGLGLVIGIPLLIFLLVTFTSR